MNKYEELIYSLIYNCKREINKEEMEILNQASAIYNTYNQLTEQLGCPLEVVFKALDKGFLCEKFVVKKDNYEDYPEKWEQWKKEYNNELQHIGNTKYLNFDLWYKTIYFSRGDTYMEVWLEDYKKTWWLKEDKSE